MKRSILTNGLKITLRHWPALIWVYALNLVLARLFSIPLASQLTALTGNSLYSQRLVSAFDLGVVSEIIRKDNEGPGAAFSASYLATWVYVAIYFLIVPGTLFVYQTDAPAKLSTLLQTGILYFWRFLRITLVSFVVFGIVLGILFIAQNHWAAHVDDKILGRPGATAWFAGYVIIGLVAAVLRVYFDLVEVYTVQLGALTPLDDSPKQAKLHRRIRKAFAPAWKTLRSNFFRAYGSFVFLFLLGLSAVIVTARIAMHSLAQPHTWLLFVLSQLGLFVMLLTRFWQRGAETELTLDNPLAAPAIIFVPKPEPEPVPQPVFIETPAATEGFSA
jgi:hypothetical protein